MQIIDTPVVETANPYTPDVEALIGAGEGKSASYVEKAGEDQDKRINALKLKFQRAANKLDRTARSTVTTAENGDATILFTLRPKQKSREVKPDDAPKPATDHVADAPAEPAETPAETPAAPVKPKPGK